MKSNNFFRLLISIIISVAAIGNAEACGPFNPIIPTPEFFRLIWWQRVSIDYDREANLRLWQSQTSEDIPLADIEQVVYHDSLDKFYSNLDCSSQKNGNRFYAYLNNSHGTEIIDFLRIAKTIETRWAEIRSVWHYPRSRNSDGEPGDFSELIAYCKAYSGERLKDRYALQVTRALFASRLYADCIEYCDSAFAAVSDDNNMKRMAQKYAAGCWKRLGDEERADSMFAQAGDVWSLSAADPAGYMLERNPDAPQLIDYIRHNAADTTMMRGLYPKAQRLVERNGAKYLGDWNFILAYIDNEFDQNPTAARKHIYKAMSRKFSSEELGDLARAYRMKLDAKVGNTATLLSDLKWIESKTDILGYDADEWIRRCQNIIYEDWIPRLWKDKDYSTAILLCGYADNLGTTNHRYACMYDGMFPDGPVVSHNIIEMRMSEDFDNTIDYKCLSFQLMGSLSSAQLASAYTRIQTATPLFAFLKRKARTDKDYYNELIGTLALREGNYARAEVYLSKVSKHYLKTMNVYKGGYLRFDPFTLYPTSQKGTADNYDAKLKFARKMNEYKRTMRHGRTADQRGLARLMYAIGRKNSFEECWALTQYWTGDNPNIFIPDLQYLEDDFSAKNYDFLYDFDQTIGIEDSKYNNEVKSALAMMTTDEAKAKAHYILNNLVTIVKLYGNTTTGHYVKTSCDRWQTWL